MEGTASSLVPLYSTLSVCPILNWAIYIAQLSFFLIGLFVLDDIYFKILHQEEIPNFVREVLKIDSSIKLFTFKGELGAGKTTICKEFIYQLSGITDISSPTFNIVSHYEFGDSGIYHYDLYRLKDKSELEELNLLENIDDSYVFIEWPEIAEDLLSYYRHIEISIITEQEARIIKISITR